MPISSLKFYADAATRVGGVGEIWYEPVTNSMRVSDGSTPGGIIVGTQTVYYGAFYSNTTQNIYGTGITAVTVESNQVASGIYIESNSKVRFGGNAAYEMTCKLQFINHQEFPQNVHVWLRKNGVDVPNSGSSFTIAGNTTVANVWFANATINNIYDTTGSITVSGTTALGDTFTTSFSTANLPYSLIESTRFPDGTKASTVWGSNLYVNSSRHTVTLPFVFSAYTSDYFEIYCYANVSPQIATWYGNANIGNVQLATISSLSVPPVPASPSVRVLVRKIGGLDELTVS